MFFTIKAIYFKTTLFQDFQSPFSHLKLRFFISKLSFIHFKTSFSRFKAPFQAVETLFFSFHPPVSSSPYLVFLISTPILFFLKLIFLISPPSFIHLKSQSQLSQTLFSYHNRFKPVFKNARILILRIRKQNHHLITIL